MDRSYYLELAAKGLRMPIGTHLVLHEQPDHEAIVKDGRRLGEVVAATARRFRTPMAVPLMDLKLEKEALLRARGVAPAAIDTFHFDDPPEPGGAIPLTGNMAAACSAIRHVAENEPDLLPMGMGIGPFSLMTKLIADPITPVYMAGTGAGPDDEPEVALVERLIDLSLHTIQGYLDAQIAAGAKAIILCEPAANTVYFSANQLADNWEIFDRYVMAPNLRLRDQMAARGVDLVFHDCGELIDGMVSRFATLDPALLSLGSSRALWDDARLVPKRTVLYGNLPTKQFYSDESVPLQRVRELAADLVARMRAAGHPFILGSECDVLSVPGAEPTIAAKVQAFLEA